MVRWGKACLLLIPILFSNLEDDIWINHYFKVTFPVEGLDTVFILLSKFFNFWPRPTVCEIWSLSWDLDVTNQSIYTLRGIWASVEAVLQVLWGCEGLWTGPVQLPKTLWTSWGLLPSSINLQWSWKKERKYNAPWTHITPAPLL